MLRIKFSGGRQFSSPKSPTSCSCKPLAESLKKNYMNENRIINSIRKGKLQLPLFEKIIYFKVPALCFFISVICISTSFEKLTLNYSADNLKIAFVLFGLGIISSVLKLNRLKLIPLENLNLRAKENILNVAEKRKWKIELNNEKAIILITIPIKGYDDYIVHNKNEGEKIYIFFDHKKILLRSLDNLDNLGFKIQNGENSANEKTISYAIKPSANSGLAQLGF